MRRVLVGFVVLVLAQGVGNTLAAEDGPSTIGTFGPAGSLTRVRASHTATLLMDDRVLVVGGIGARNRPALAEVWDPATASFVPAAKLAQARSSHTAMLLPDGRVLVVGGWATSETDSPRPKRGTR